VDGEDTLGLGETVRAAADQNVLTIFSNVPDLESSAILTATTPTIPSGENRLLAVPRPASMLLGTVVSAISKKHTIRRACATVMVPASERGKRGNEELHEQVVKILNFQEAPTDVFPTQLAFNLILPSVMDQKPGVLDDAVSEEAAAVAEIDSVLSVMMVQAPVFHGYASSLWIELKDPIEEEKLIQSIEESGLIDTSSLNTSVAASPVSVAESDRIHVGSLRRDGSSSSAFWLWVVADTLAVDTATYAVRAAERILGVAQGEA
jgi:aspartate-semialdehyde dehydrogenase